MSIHLFIRGSIPATQSRRMPFVSGTRSLRNPPALHAPFASHLVVDSTGLKVFGEGEWLENKHKLKRKRWRKLHLNLDLASGEIVCSDLTTDDVGDPTALCWEHV